MGDHQYGFIPDQRFNAFWIWCSFSGSAKAVASSSTTMGASFNMAAGKSDPLLFAAGEIHASGSHNGVQTMREFFQNVIALGSVCGGQDFLSGSVRPGCPDIFQKALFKQPSILKHKGCLFHQVFRIHFFDIDAPDETAPLSASQKRGIRLAAVVLPPPEGLPALSPDRAGQQTIRRKEPGGPRRGR